VTAEFFPLKFEIEREFWSKFWQESAVRQPPDSPLHGQMEPAYQHPGWGVRPAMNESIVSPL
jgi:hypothetical protein